MPTLTLKTRADLACVIGMSIERPLAAVVAEVRTLAVDSTVDAKHITLAFRDPLDAVLGWRHLDRVFGGSTYLMSVVASAAAVEMLRDPSELAREALAALTSGATGTPAERGLVLVRTGTSLLFRPAVEPLEYASHALALLVIDGRRDRVVVIEQPGWIGRDFTAPVRIDDPWMSRRHAELGVDSHAGWFVRSNALAEQSGVIHRGTEGHGFSIANEPVKPVRHALHQGLVLQFGPERAILVLS